MSSRLPLLSQSAWRNVRMLHGLRNLRERRGGEWKRSICPYCGTGCGVLARAKDGAVAEVRGDPEHPVNRGKLCAKGALLAPMVRTDDRLLFPLLRERRAGDFRRVSWHAAAQRFAAVIRAAQAEHGPHSVMLYGSGQLVTEDYYLFGKIAKGFLRTNNQDTNSRLCMASAVVAYNLAVGSDSPPCSYADIEAAKTFLIVGANTEACHPILFNRIKARKRADKDVRVIVVDPRRTRTAEIADIHLRPRPGTDVALLNSLLYEALLAGGGDQAFIDAHTTGWEELRQALGDYQAERAFEWTGVPAQEVVDAARIYARNGPALSLWAMGLNQSTRGVDNNLAIINLALATGNIGKPGAGPFSLTGQPNAMGGREAGGLATALPGHRMVANAEHRAELEAAWGVEPGAISERPGLTAMEMVEALEEGAVKVLWVAGTNPLASLPNTERVKRAVAKADFVAVQDAYHPTETTAAANLVLPAAQWSERSGTMTNSERRVCLLERIGEPPGEALPDWQIICRVAQALGYGRAFAYADEEAIFAEYRELTRGRDLDMTGLTYERLRASSEGVQWPASEAAPASSTRLFGDGRFSTPDGKARFHAVRQESNAEELTDAYPLALLTGRVKDQWHTRTRTGKVAKLNKSEPSPFVEVHPQDARTLALRDGQAVRVVSRRGAFTAPARVTEAVAPGAVFAPFHWGPLWSAESTPNLAAAEAFDARSKEPELKFAAVRLEAVEA